MRLDTLKLDENFTHLIVDPDEHDFNEAYRTESLTV